MAEEIDIGDLYNGINPVEDLFVTHIMGGMMEFEKTGVYPDKLTIVSFKHNHKWYIKVKGDKQQGTLKIKRVAVYEYDLTDEVFKVRVVENEMPITDWIHVSMNTLLRD